ncbi:hypothetical protein E3T43_07405 [Cryobacterium sp. Hh7]|uniref:hypothetical protein n=1 Tax=Cryobacterium sp. Hh7 TaxID=1259159 RepID=UPI00106D85AA|nr:hypothetical protein [Cryobacterium sp. Hh7]TFD58064.1 hypothetical protein E3T43_07405 [Cryobacterium sp. Hh7]
MEIRSWLSLLFVIAAVLPVLAFARLLRRSNRALAKTLLLVESRGSVVGTIADHDKVWSDITVAPRENRTAVRWDISLVGIGLLAGAIASIWSLFIPGL